MIEPSDEIIEKYGILENMLEGVRLIDKNKKYLYLNESAAIQDGFKKEELIGQPITEKYVGIISKITECILSKEKLEFITYSESLNGTRSWFETRMIPVIEGAIFMSWEITEQRNIDFQLQHQNEIFQRKIEERTLELENSLKAEQQLKQLKNTFLAIALHEFRTPLSTIITSVNLLQHNLDSSIAQARTKHLKNIKSSIIKLKGILNDFLAFDKMESGNLTYDLMQVNTKSFLQETINELSLLCQPNQKINFSFTGNDFARIDINILRHILFNIISNSLKYSPEGNDISVCVTTRNNSLQLTVKDSGIGIPEEAQSSIFDKFYRGSNATYVDGIGIGLTVVKGFVELAKGKISFNSTIPEGSIFSIELPQ